MKKFICLFASLFLFVACNKEEKKTEVVVCSYKSFTGEWGAGLKIAKKFEEATGCSVHFITCKDSGEILHSLENKNDSLKADVVLGIDNYLLPKLLKADVLSPYKPKRYEEIDEALVMNEATLITPFDFGYFAFMYNTESDVPPPTSLKDLSLPQYKDQIVIMDPQTSTPGLGTLLWIYAAHKEDYVDVWKSICGNVLSMPTSWSQGYALFKSGEVPLAISYTTSLAAHMLYDETDKLQPLIFDEGHICQIEGMGLLKGCENEKNAKAFLDFMLSDEAQIELAETQFMFPVMKSVELPASFSTVPSPTRVLDVKVDEDDGHIENIVQRAMEAIK